MKSFLQAVFTLMMYFLGGCLLAGAVIPAGLLFVNLWILFAPKTVFQRVLLISCGIGFGYFLFGLTLCLETVLVRYLFDLKLKPQQCEICGWAQTAPDGRLPLELDHINGNRMDNRLENLRILCPNCHSLQSTHRARNRKKKTN